MWVQDVTLDITGKFKMFKMFWYFLII